MTPPPPRSLHGLLGGCCVGLVAAAHAHLEGAARKADLFAEVYGRPAEFASS